MIKHIKVACLLALTIFTVSGCSMLNTALSAAVAYGIYQATR